MYCDGEERGFGSCAAIGRNSAPDPVLVPRWGGKMYSVLVPQTEWSWSMSGWWKITCLEINRSLYLNSAKVTFRRNTSLRFEQPHFPCWEQARCPHVTISAGVGVFTLMDAQDLTSAVMLEERREMNDDVIRGWRDSLGNLNHMFLRCV